MSNENATENVTVERRQNNRGQRINPLAKVLLDAATVLGLVIVALIVIIFIVSATQGVSVIELVKMVVKTIRMFFEYLLT